MYQPVQRDKFHVAGWNDEMLEYVEQVRITCPVGHIAEYGAGVADHVADLAELVEWANIHRDCEAVPDAAP